MSERTNTSKHPGGGLARALLLSYAAAVGAMAEPGNLDELDLMLGVDLQERFARSRVDDVTVFHDACLALNDEAERRCLAQRGPAHAKYGCRWCRR